MKGKAAHLIIIVSILFIGSLQANSQVKKTCLGRWDFEAPSAPQGYNFGVIEIKNDSINTIFSGTTYKFPSVWVRITNDSVTYKTVIDGTDVLFSLKVENASNIGGNAVWSDGETRMILKKKTN
ncbi:MAG: hypothetical protein Q8868_10675 [Bacteroidota bacterium]|nr:hypothetical protein [Bacteroidota bacterium]